MRLTPNPICDSLQHLELVMSLQSLRKGLLTRITESANPDSLTSLSFRYLVDDGRGWTNAFFRPQGNKSSARFMQPFGGEYAVQSTLLARAIFMQPVVGKYALGVAVHISYFR